MRETEEARRAIQTSMGIQFENADGAIASIDVEWHEGETPSFRRLDRAADTVVFVPWDDALPLDGASKGWIDNAQFLELSGGSVVSSSEVIPAAHRYESLLPPRPNCDIDMMFVTSGAPGGDLYTYMEVVNGVPVTVRNVTSDHTAAIRVEMSFEVYLAMRVGECTSLDVIFIDGSIQGDLFDIMLFGGLVTSPGWLQANQIAPSIRELMLQFREFCKREASFTQLLEIAQT